VIFDVGDAAPITTNVLDASGTLTNAAVAVAVTRPDGTTGTVSAPTNLSTGVYRALVTVDQAGLWRYTFTWSGAVVGVDAGEFTAVTPGRVLVASFDEFKKHLNRTDVGDDPELRTYLEAATDWVERRIGGPVSVQTFIELIPLSGWWIIPAYRPLVSVTSLTPELGAALDSSTYVVDALRGAIRIRWGASSGWHTLVYKAGLAVIPERVKLAGLIVAAHLWQVQNGGGGMPFPGDSDVPQFGQGFAVPNRAKELLSVDTIPGFA
jgi:hypothetical protein